MTKIDINTRNYRVLNRILAMALICAGSEALGQESGNSSRAGASDEGVPDIVVTAQRREERQQDVPIAITAATAEMLTASNVNGTLDLARVSPGLVTYQIGASFQPFIRGVGTNQSSPGFESPVALYVDGVYQGYKGGNVTDLGDVERIEVLKGPQGTLFGRNATGGAVSVITRDPGAAMEAEGEVGYGRFDEFRAKAYLGGPISDTVGASASFTARRDHGYIYDIARRKNSNPGRFLVGTGKLVWSPSTVFHAELSGRYYYRRDNSYASHHPHPGTLTIAESRGFLVARGDYQTSLSFDAGSWARGHAVTLNADYDLGRVKLVSITGYKKDQSLSQSDGDESPATLAASGTKQPSRQISQELQLQSDGSGAFNWIVGGYYLWFREGFGNPPQNLLSGANIPFPIRPIDLLAPGASATGITGIVTTNAYAAFAEASYRITRSDRLTLGIRYNSEEKAIVGSIYRYAAVPGSGLGLPLFGGTTGASSDNLMFSRTPVTSMDKAKTWSRPTWRATFDHHFNDDVMAYASYNRGFKSGSFNPAAISPTQVPVNPERIDAFEIGLKSEFFDRRVRFNVAGYHYDYKDIQIGLITGTGIQTVQNAASGSVWGLDLDLVVAPVRNLTLTAQGSFLNTKYKSFPNAQALIPNVQGVACQTPARAINLATARQIAGGVPTGGNCAYSLDVSGHSMAFAPRFTGTLGINYRLPLADQSSLEAAGSLYHNSGFDVTPGGIFGHVQPHENLALSLTWNAPGDRFFTRIWGDNVTGDIHEIYISNQGSAVQVVNNRPTTYGFTIGFRLGR